MMEILRMNESHVEQVAQLEKLSFSDPWSANAIASELSNNLSLWLVAMDADKLVGYVGSQSVMGWTDMMNIAVHPDYRRQGIAEALIAALSQSLKALGNECLTLEVRPSNAPAVALYHKLGFVQVGCRPNYYHNPREDALILRKQLL